MESLESLRAESVILYSYFVENKLVLRSQEFGQRTRNSVVVPKTEPLQVGSAQHYHVLEIREVEGNLVAGCAQFRRITHQEIMVSNDLKWFDRYKDKFRSVEDGIAFMRAFIAGYNDAEIDHWKAGVEHAH